MTAKEFKELKTKTEKGFYMFHFYYEFIVIFDRTEKHLFIKYKDISYRGGCGTEKQALETAMLFLNKWINNE